MQDHAQNLVIKQLAPSRDRDPLFIVGDVHGCARELADLLKKARERLSRFQLVLVGDLFTKGPDPVGVYEIIQENQAVCIKGNHDWALWASIVQAQKKGLQSLPEHTQQTLHLIRYHKRAVFDLLSSLPHAYTTTVSPRVQRKGWEDEYPLIIVHAGVDPSQGLLSSSERMLLTARYVRWENAESGRRLVVVPSGYRSEVLQQSAAASAASKEVPAALSSTQFHSMSPRAERPGRTGSGERPRAVLPPIEKFRWHELHNGPELIVFGHDAKQGLFRKTIPSGRPVCVGIDTGCTYGRALTGYFPEFDDAIQVPARRTYFDIVKNVIMVRSASPRVAV
ncbi:MAG: serine/threonine protein phosphatase [Silvanigrellales bacterium]|nr:serine/threonine protein phosphatase [Silvanigrellales bacterium]